MTLHLGNVRFDPAEDPTALIEELLGARVTAVTLVKRSLDARHRKQVWRGVFRVEVEDEETVLSKELPSVRRWTGRDEGRYGLSDGAPAQRRRFEQRAIVVGAGPAGLFAALYLAEAGASVLLLDRGGPVERRVTAVNGWWRRKVPFDPENNILFGEGGSGTFSDGKIYTRRRDGELGFIFRRLVDFGADPELLTDALAHLGTDKVRAILPVFRARLEELGVEVRYGTYVRGLCREDGRCVGVITDDGEELGSPVIFGPGHSARDTLKMLVAAGASARPRNIAIGARIEHPQSLIDEQRYGKARGDLPAASYRFAWHPEQGRKGRTFCMCPGGMVVPAGSEANTVVVNGMSFAARRAFWANSAVIVEVETSDYDGQDPLAGIRYQERIEQACFIAGGGTYAAPAQRVTDFLARRASVDLPRTSFPMGTCPSDLWMLLPEEICVGMEAAILAFEKDLPGFAGTDAVLIAPETRTTSPVSFERTEDGESSISGLYLVGEGAGYAGGIVSSALDGLRAARQISLQYGCL